MSLSRLRISLALIAISALVGCGYSPAFGPSGSAQALRVNVAMDAPDSRNEFDLVNQLELRLGRSSSPRYQLSYDINTIRDGVGVTPQQEIIRLNIFGKVSYSLTDMATGEVVTKGSTDTFTGYSVGAVDTTAAPPSTNATISTLAAERDALSRLMVTLADQIVTRLIATSGAWAG